MIQEKRGQAGREAFLEKYATREELAEHMRGLAQRNARLSRVGRLLLESYEKVLTEAGLKNGGSP